MASSRVIISLYQSRAYASTSFIFIQIISVAWVILVWHRTFLPRLDGELCGFTRYAQISVSGADHSIRRVEIQSIRAVATGSIARLSRQAASRVWESQPLPAGGFISEPAVVAVTGYGHALVRRLPTVPSQTATDKASEAGDLALEPPVDVVYGVIRASLERTGQPIGANYLLIAAHAVALGLTVVTDNERDFSRIDGLRVENWLR